MRFEWDPAKAAANRRAHGVTFAEAVTALEDTFALTREDPDAVTEKRFVTLGMTDQAKLLVVVYAYRGHDQIRIISAWKASKPQRKSHEENRS
ncbi:MAG TPA: BrnT family toxin [Thermoanaerobaculia bacterium]